MLMLRFRDLMIPDGQTIERHRKIVETSGCVYWGWIMRDSEVFPKEFLRKFSAACEAVPQSIALLHSGSFSRYIACCSGLVTTTVGRKIETPDLARTPSYMHESECAVWFFLKTIDDEHRSDSFSIEEMPTLSVCSQHDQELLAQQELRDFRALRESGGTLWITSE